MNPPGKVLVFGGLVLASFGMLYGLYYALAVEHQSLERMGGSLANAFLAAANQHPAESENALAVYRETKYDYVRQVDLHSHWIGLAMLMIVLGMAFDSIAFSEGARLGLALTLLAGSVAFPLGVILETNRGAREFGSGLAVIGSALVIMALAAIAMGLSRNSRA